MYRSLKTIGTFAVTLVVSTSGFSAPSRRAPAALQKSAASAGPGRSSIALFGVPHPNVITMMPASVERPPQKTRGSGGPAVLDRPEVVEKKKSRSRSAAKQGESLGSESWEVRIYNDGINTREFVARCLVQIAGLTEMAAYQTMMHAHQNGLAVVGRYPYERAEMYHDALKTNGIMNDLVPVEDE